jgi:hypothetical protein
MKLLSMALLLVLIGSSLGQQPQPRATLHADKHVTLASPSARTASSWLLDHRRFPLRDSRWILLSTREDRPGRAEQLGIIERQYRIKPGGSPEPPAPGEPGGSPAWVRSLRTCV